MAIVVSPEEWQKNIKYQGDGYVVYQSPIRCPDNDPPIPEGWQIAWAGGGWPYVVVYDPAKIETIWFTAGSIERGELDEFVEGNKGRIIAVLPASVHGCWKVKANQRLVVARKEG